MDDKANRIIFGIAKDLNLPYDKVREVCEFQFKVVEKVVEKGKDEIRLPFLGKFIKYKTWKQSKGKLNQGE